MADHSHTPYQPSEGSRAWGYVLPLLFLAGLLMLLGYAFASWMLVGGAVTALATGVVWALAQAERDA